MGEFEEGVRQGIAAASGFGGSALGYDLLAMSIVIVPWGQKEVHIPVIETDSSPLFPDVTLETMKIITLYPKLFINVFGERHYMAYDKEYKVLVVGRKK
jgi:hypothetical protein